ncbi:caspase family protein [Streptomyces sp. NPDC101062]|uniref:VMAP-C domain-containing protein n=1 Tax=unclassified Streptomyces TaxID=2593676 RepID=UPI00382BA4DE
MRAAETAPAAPTTSAAPASVVAPHDWRRTHAVLVAVESYRGSEDSELDGPVQDAIGMHRWLTRQGVPPENIHVLASPLERNRAALDAAVPGGYRTADRADVRRVFRDELRRIDSDWLWVYWAGHGVQARGGRWSLLYPDTRDTDLLGLDADNLIHLMRTECLPGRGVDRVTIVIDACRQALPARTHPQAAVPEELTEATQSNHDRQIFVMRASQAGAVAKNQDGGGVFTTVLLDQLMAAEGDDGAGPDLDRVWSGVAGEFDRRRSDNGHFRQIPTLYAVNWRGDATEPPARPVRASSAPGTPERTRARDKLILETTGLLESGQGGAAATATVVLCDAYASVPPNPLPSAADLVDWALDQPHGVPTLLHVLAGQVPGASVSAPAWEACRLLQDGQWLTGPEYDELVSLLEELDARARGDVAGAARTEIPSLGPLPTEPGALADALEKLLPREHQLPQLLRAVERYAAFHREPVGNRLRDWSSRCAVRIGLEAALLDRRGDADDTAERTGAKSAPVDERVQIRLHPPTGSGQRRRYEVWARRDAGTESLAKVDTPASLAEIQRGVDELLSGHARTNDTVVEFFVAAKDLELDVHCWELGAAGPVRRFLGTDFPVVVRCVEFREERRHLWERKWDRVASAGTGDLHWLPGHMEATRKVYGDLQHQEDIPGVVMTTPKRARQEVFTACLFLGVPVLVWHNERELTEAEHELKALLGTERLTAFPGRLRTLRAASESDENQPGRHLALLWDDPHRPLPEQLDLSAP